MYLCAGSGFEFSSEHRIWLCEVLGCALPKVGLEETERFVASVLISITAWRDLASLDGISRDAADALRGLWLLAAAEDPPVGQIRNRVAKLPSLALVNVERRARFLWPVLFGEPLPASGIVGWSKNAEASALVSGLRAVIALGATLKLGRQRANGQRSRAHIEPDVLMVLRGGRPSKDAAEWLVTMLAADWLAATGSVPLSGRSDKTPFGELVHHVFGWLELDGADATLRRYWSSVAQHSVSKGPTGD
jgi:hypothetical protein